MARLRARWGHRWHIVHTGRTWIATTYRRPGLPIQVESAPAPEQLEEQQDRLMEKRRQARETREGRRAGHTQPQETEPEAPSP